MSQSLLAAKAASALTVSDPQEKCAAVASLAAELADGVLAPEVATAVVLAEPGVPERPRLVDPREVPRRGLGTAEGHAALIHAVTHIEFSAINLALDAVCRFAGMPPDYYQDWVGVAAEEALHFKMIAAHLGGLGYAYGDLPAHNGLWHTAARSGHDVLVRMALVPRVMEARGLDVTPDMIERLLHIGDGDGAGILERILADEVGHVAVGSRWFRWLCASRQLDPTSTFLTLVNEELGPPRPGAVNWAARLAAGFTEPELAALFPAFSPNAS